MAKKGSKKAADNKRLKNLGERRKMRERIEREWEYMRGLRESCYLWNGVLYYLDGSRGVVGQFSENGDPIYDTDWRPRTDAEWEVYDVWYSAFLEERIQIRMKERRQRRRRMRKEAKRIAAEEVKRLAEEEYINFLSYSNIDMAFSSNVLQFNKMKFNPKLPVTLMPKKGGRIEWLWDGGPVTLMPKKGGRNEGKWDNGKWYQGTVIEATPNSITVLYDDGTTFTHVLRLKELEDDVVFQGGETLDERLARGAMSSIDLTLLEDTPVKSKPSTSGSSLPAIDLTQDTPVKKNDAFGPNSIIGKKINVRWIMSRGGIKIFQGTIDNYDQGTKLHHVTYDDGDTYSYEIIDPVLLQIAFLKHVLLRHVKSNNVLRLEIYNEPVIVPVPVPIPVPALTRGALMNINDGKHAGKTGTFIHSSDRTYRINIRGVGARNIAKKNASIQIL